MSADLAARVAALADEWERDEAYACRNASECVRCVSFQRAVIRLRDLLAVPQPEPVAEQATCWRSECRNGCYYPDVCSERPSAAAGPDEGECRDSVEIYESADEIYTPATPDAQTIEDVLAAHRPFGFACACGWEDRTATYASAHRAHVAAALAAAGLLATDGKAE